MVLAMLLAVVLASQTAGGAPASGLNRLLAAEIQRTFPPRPPLDPESPPAAVEFEAIQDYFTPAAGLYVKHLRTGEDAAINADLEFETQSVIKVPIMILAFQLADRGELDLDQLIEIQKANFVVASGVLVHLKPGSSITLRDVITLMIITSDNIATDIVLERVGGVGRLNEWLQQSGYRNTMMPATTFESWRWRFEVADERYRSLTHEQVYAIRTSDAAFAGMTEEELKAINAAVEQMRRKPLRTVREIVKKRGLPLYYGKSTPRELGQMLEGIETSTIASPTSCLEMKRILRAQQLNSGSIPGYLDVPVGHKSGGGGPDNLNDVGIVYARSGPIVISFFTQNINQAVHDTEDGIAEVSRLIVEYFDGAHPRPSD